MTGRGLGFFLQVVDVRSEPENELPCLREVLKGKARCAGDAFVEEHDRASPGIGDELRAPAIRGDQGRLGRGQGNVIISRGKEAVDAERPDEPDRKPRGADEYSMFLENSSPWETVASSARAARDSWETWPSASHRRATASGWRGRRQEGAVPPARAEGPNAARPCWNLGLRVSLRVESDPVFARRHPFASI